MQEENLFVPGCRGDGNSLISQLKTVDGCPLPWFPNVQKSKTVPVQTQRPYVTTGVFISWKANVIFNVVQHSGTGPSCQYRSSADSDATVTTA